MSRSDPQGAAEFVRALIVGDEEYDRQAPQHMIAMGAVRRFLKHYDLLTAIVPDLATRIDKLDLDGDREALAEQVLGILREAIGGGSAQAAASGPMQLAWGDPGGTEFEGVVAIDLGTSNVVCAHWNYQVGDPLVSSYEPVAVNVLDAKAFERLSEGSYLVGKEAVDHKKSLNLYQSFRRFLGTQERTRPAITGSHMTQVRIPTLVKAALKELLERLIRQTGRTGARFPKVVVTVPAGGDIAFEDELRGVFDELKLSGSTELDETTAGGVYYLLNPILRREYAQEELGPVDWYVKRYGLTVDDQGAATLGLLCVDFGGGTTDLSLLKFTIEQDRRTCRVHIEVQDNYGFRDLSGEGLTLYLFDLLKRRLALLLLDPTRSLTGTPGAPLTEHPLAELHEHEADSSDLYRLKELLPEDLTLLAERWAEVASHHPLEERLRDAVERLFPTRYASAPKTTIKLRRSQFRYLWEEAERLKRAVSAKRSAVEDDPNQTARRVVKRLDLKGCPPAPKGGLHPDERVRAAGLDPLQATTVDGIAISDVDVDAFVIDRGKERLVAAIQRMGSSGLNIARVLLTGNGAHDARFAFSRALQEAFSLSADRIDFSPEDAKTAVAKGACLWAVGNRLEGIQVSLARRPRHPSSLVLVSALEQEDLYQEGDPINRFCYFEPPPREGDAGDKLIQIDRRLGQQLHPYLMFNPAKGVPIKPIGEYPITKRYDVEVAEVDRFLESTVDGGKVDFAPRNPAQYSQLESGEWISDWEMFERLRTEMTMAEAVSWVEGCQQLQKEPPEGHAFHRYYMNESRQLYLLFHARGERLLVRGEVTEQARRHLPAELDPFSGVH